MCDQTEIHYLDGDVVWVKLGSFWWPGQVVDMKKLPEEIELELRKKPPVAVVKFFQEEYFEFVKNYHLIYKYNCTQKEEFIKKGLEKLRAKSKDGSSSMDKFPDDIKMAEILTDGDPNILLDKKFCPQEKPDISGLFGEKKIPKKKRNREESMKKQVQMARRSVTHPRFLRESDHEVRIRAQPPVQTSSSSNTPKGNFSCQLCDFSTNRVNVLICHMKNHSSSNNTPVRQKSKVKTSSPTKSKVNEPSPVKEKSYKKVTYRKKKSDQMTPEQKHLKTTERPEKKKTDAELREKLLADWNEDSDDNDSAEFDKTLKDDSKGESTKEKENGSELSRLSVTSPQPTDFLMESNKLLEETSSIVKFTHMDVDDLQTSLNLKLPKKRSENSQSNESEIVEKSSNVKNDEESRLSCFDFNEDDISEPSISPCRKIPRSLGIKKNKEMEITQTPKNDEDSKVIQNNDSIDDSGKIRGSDKMINNVNKKGYNFFQDKESFTSLDKKDESETQECSENEKPVKNEVNNDITEKSELNSFISTSNDLPGNHTQLSENFHEPEKILAENFPYDDDHTSLDPNFLKSKKRRKSSLKTDETVESIEKTNNKEEFDSLHQSKKQKLDDKNELSCQSFDLPEAEDKLLDQMKSIENSECAMNICDDKLLNQGNKNNTKNVIENERKIEFTEDQDLIKNQLKNLSDKSTCSNVKEDLFNMDHDETEDKCIVDNDSLPPKKFQIKKYSLSQINKIENTDSNYTEESSSDSKINNTNSDVQLEKNILDSKLDTFQKSTDIEIDKEICDWEKISIDIAGKKDSLEIDNNTELNDLKNDCPKSFKNLDFIQNEQIEKNNHSGTTNNGKEITEDEILNSNNPDVEKTNKEDKKPLESFQKIEELNKSDKVNVQLSNDFVLSSKNNETSGVAQNLNTSMEEIKNIKSNKSDLTSISPNTLKNNIKDIPVKNREKPRIIENIALKKPMILKKKVLDKSFGKIIGSSPNSRASNRYQKTEMKGSFIQNKSIIVDNNQKKAMNVTILPHSDPSKVEFNTFMGEPTSLNIDDIDINSIPLVIGKDILTPESIKQMPVVISSTLPSKMPISPNKGEKSPVILHQSVNSKKRLSGAPTILKTKNKGKPMITSIETIVPPTNVTPTMFEKAYKLSPQPLKIVDNQKKSGSTNSYVIVAGSKSLQAHHQVKLANNKPSSSNAQIVQQGGKVVIISPTQQSTLHPGLITKNTINKSPKTTTIITSKQNQQFHTTLINSPIRATKNISEVQGIQTSKTGKEVPHKLHSIFKSKNLNQPIVKKKAANLTLLDTFPQVISKKIITSINDQTVQGSPALKSNKIITTNISALPNTPKNFVIHSANQAFSTKNLFSSQGIVSKSPILKPVTGSHIKILAANKTKNQKFLSKNSPGQERMQSLKELDGSLLKLNNKNAVTTVVNFDSKNGDTLNIKQNVQKVTLKNSKVVSSTVTTQVPIGAVKQARIDLPNKKNVKESSILSKPISEKSILNKKIDNHSQNNLNKIKSDKKVDHATIISPDLSKDSFIIKNQQRNVVSNEILQINTPVEKIEEVNMNVEIKPQFDSKNFETNKQSSDPILKSLQQTSPQLAVVPATDNTEETSYLLVTVNEKGEYVPFDTSALISFEEQASNQNNTIYLDSNTISDGGNLGNIILQVDNNSMTCIQPSTEIVKDEIPATQSTPLSSQENTQTRKCNQDILAVALADSDFQQEISTAETTEINTMENFTETSLINQTILQSTIIPTTEPISSASVLETSLTLNQPIMTPLEVPSTLSSQSELTSVSFTVATTNSEISIVPENQTVVCTPIEQDSSETDSIQKIQINDEINSVETLQQSKSESFSLDSCSVTLPKDKDYENIQTTLSMPIIDDQCNENNTFTNTEEKDDRLFDQQNAEEKDQVQELEEKSSSSDFYQHKDKDEDEETRSEQCVNPVSDPKISESSDSNNINECNFDENYEEAICTNKEINEKDQEALTSPVLVEKCIVESENHISDVNDQIFPKDDTECPIEKDFANNKNDVDQSAISEENDQVPKSSTNLQIEQIPCELMEFDSNHLNSDVTVDEPLKESEDNNPQNTKNMNEPITSLSEQSYEKSSNTHEEVALNSESINEQSNSFKSCENNKVEYFLDNLNTDNETNHSSNQPSQAREIEIDNIDMPTMSLNQSVFGEDENAISSYVPETPETQERDQDQESAISSSSYEIPPCEELNFQNSITDASGMNNSMRVLEMAASYIGLNLESNHFNTLSIENQACEDQTVTTTFNDPTEKNEVDINTNSDTSCVRVSNMETTSQESYPTESCNITNTNELNNIYSQQQDHLDNYFENLDQSENSKVNSSKEKSEVENTVYFKNDSDILESSQNFSHEISNFSGNESLHGYYDSSVIIPISPTAKQSCYEASTIIESEPSQDIEKLNPSCSSNSENVSKSEILNSSKFSPEYNSDNPNLNRHDTIDSSATVHYMSR